MAAFIVGRSVFTSSKIRNASRLLPLTAGTTQITLESFLSSKHWNPKWKKLRAQKVIKVKLPNFDEERKLDKGKLTPDEMRAKMKEKGVCPPRHWVEKPYFISCTDGIFDPYIPPEGDGKMSSITVTGAKQNFVFLGKKGKSVMAARKIRNFDEDFDARIFAENAHEIYMDAHKALAEKNDEQLHELVTEKAFPEMMHNVKFTTLHWKFLRSLEAPQVVHIRCTDVISKDNVFAQVTVRFHTQQVLAVYDRFGHLMFGSEVVAKDVLEYVVFEKHLANEYGTWRIQGKIIPDWMPPKDPVLRTFIKPDLEVTEPEKSKSEVATKDDLQHDVSTN